LKPIIIKFLSNNLGRIEFEAQVMTGDRMSLDTITFKLDTGSDFTILCYEDLKLLGYSDKTLRNSPHFESDKVSVYTGSTVKLQYIENVSIKFGDRELQGCKVFFAFATKSHNLFGGDILKFFNTEINYDESELRLTERKYKPTLSKGETPIQVYLLES